MEEPVGITILGQKLLIKSSHGEAAVRRVAESLEEKVFAVRTSGVTVDSMRMLLYAAFQLTDENMRMKEELGNLEERVSSAVGRMLGKIERD